MSIIYLVTPRGQFSLDATSSVQQTFSNQITEYPVESGFDFTKGVISKSDYYTLSGVISDYHLKDSRDFRSDEVLTSLKQIKESRSIVSLVMKSNVVGNLVIESISATESTGTGHAKEVTITLKEVRTAFSATTTVPRQARQLIVTGESVADVTDSKKNAGTKPKESTEDNRTYLARLLGIGEPNNAE